MTGWFYWLLKYVLVGPWIKRYNKVVIEGLENVPDEGAAIMAGNHLSIADWLFVPVAVKRRITFLAKSEYFTRPGFKGALEKFFYTQTGNVPIDRSGADAAQAALNTAKEQLAQGRLVGLYPEGTRSPDGRLYKGKTGIARLALETGIPVIPMAVIGTDKVSPPGSKKWYRVQVIVKFGKPMEFSRYAGLSGNRFVERAITDEIMYELMKMSGQTYVDVYAASIKNKKKPEKSASADRIPDTQAG